MVINRFIWIAFLLVGLCTTLHAQQSIQIKQYTSKDGVSQNFVYSINQDSKGYLWIGSGEGVFKYNGFVFSPLYKGDSLAENYISVGFTDSKGGIWWGHQEGGITHYSGKDFEVIDVSDLPSGKVNSIKEDNEGHIWFSLQGHGLFRIKDGVINNYSSVFEDLIVFDFEFAFRDLLLVGTDEGLYLYQMSRDGSPMKLMKVNKIPLAQINHISKAQTKDSYWIGTEDQGLFKINVHPDNKDFIQVLPIGEGYQLNDKNVEHILEDRSGNLWISTHGEGIFKASYSQSAVAYIDIQQMADNYALQSNDINLIFEDREGNIWAGSHGGNLYFIKDNLFEQYIPYFSEGGSRDVRAILVDSVNYYYGSYGRVIIERKADNTSEFFGPEEGIPDDLITAIYKDEKGNIWIGTDANGAYVKFEESNKFIPLELSMDNLANSINSITGGDQFIWIATKFGLFKYNTITETYEKYSTENELKHNNISHLYKDPKSADIWVATQSNYLTRIRGFEITDYEIKSEGSILNMSGVYGDSDGNIWIATQGDGVYKFDVLEKEFEHFGLNNQLLSEYCYSLVIDDKDNVWVGHRGGVSRILIEKGQVKTYETENGFKGDCYPNAIFRDRDNNIWFGTNEGAFKFVQSKDIVNTIAPKTDLLRVIVSSGEDETIYTEGPIYLPYDEYKIRFEFIGLSFKNVEDVTYQYKLEDYDLEWTDGSVNNFAQYNRIEEGQYKFKVRSCNSDGFCSEKETTFIIEIATPYWKQWWFIALCVITLIVVTVIYIRFRERRQRAIQEYLQRELDERTKEVIEQKEELEVKNKDITDSINYAKRIQRAVIPNYARIAKVFPNSFVYFKPRDIVSGDFYWVHQPSDDIFLIACADATGHGVPGAFMSLIGSTLLQDSARREDVQSPEDILHTLEEELVQLLTNEGRDENPKDGMDISVCEFNLKSNTLRVASAMRPVFIISEGEMITVKASRNPIGGGYKNFEKKFELQEYQLKKGDAVYMFTDGYPDQFGGPDGKKFKMSRLKKIFTDIQGLSAEEQLNEIDREFSLWTEGYEQIDDVLVMGVII